MVYTLSTVSGDLFKSFKRGKEIESYINGSVQPPYICPLLNVLLSFEYILGSVYIDQIITMYILNICKFICQLYLNNASPTPLTCCACPALTPFTRKIPIHPSHLTFK